MGRKREHPDGHENINWDAHIIANRVEDAQFLMSHGYSLEQTARRLGLNLDTLEKTLERHG